MISVEFSEQECRAVSRACEFFDALIANHVAGHDRDPDEATAVLRSAAFKLGLGLVLAGAEA